MRKLFVIYALIAMIFISCNTDVDNITSSYVGIVVDANTQLPLSNIPVIVTDGSNIHTSVTTNLEGKFSFAIKISEINGNYFILVGDDTCIKKRVEIPGFANGETNVGIIQIYGPDMPSVSLRGFKIDGNIITANAEVKDDGRLDVLNRGFCYSTSATPTTQDEIIACGEGLGSFSAKIKIQDLNVSSTYYFRPYATNSKGTAYGSSFSYTTGDGLPSVDMHFYSWSYEGISNVTRTSVDLEGELFSDGGFEVLERGFCLDTNGFPSMDTEHKYIGGGELGRYYLTINSLTPNTKYYVRAYAKNKNGISYGSMVEFTTEKGAEDIGFIEIPALGIAVQTEDIGVGNWISINAMCENSIAGGYTDWRLPTIDELMSIYTYRDMIGNFETSSPPWANYWSGDIYSSDSFYGINFSNGSLMRLGYEYEYGIGRCVRTLNSK